MSLEERWRRELDDLRAARRYRALRAAGGMDFSSNDYLGLGGGATDGAARTRNEGGWSGMASRLLRGHHPVWDEVETTLAEWHGAEAALIFTSGYVANEGLLATVIRAGDVAFSDQSNHASLIDGLRLGKGRRVIFNHNDLSDLERHLTEAARRREPGQAFFIVTESLFGMDGDRAPLVAMIRLAERFQAHLIVDEAHATGCFGPEGSGLVNALGLRERVLATVHTGGKALGVAGAYMCGGALLKEILVNQCRHLIFTTALPPTLGCWWLEAVQRVRREETLRERLHGNARIFRQALRDQGIDCPGTDYVVPVLLGSDARAVAAATRLQDAGFDVRAIRPPTVAEGTARLRVSIHADHKEADLYRLAKSISV